MLKKGDTVQHKLSGSWLTVLDILSDERTTIKTLVLRTKDFKTIELFDWEVILVQNKFKGE